MKRIGGKNMEMKDRIREILGDSDLTLSAFSKKIGMPPSSLSEFLNKSDKIKYVAHNVLENILLEYPKVNPGWLLTGNGGKYIDKVEKPKRKGNGKIIKIVLTGGSYSGKTTLINLLRTNYTTVSDTALDIIEELAKMSPNPEYVKEFRKWSPDNSENILTFQHMIAFEQIKRELVYTVKLGDLEQNKLVFFDRGFYDCVGYLNYNKIPTPPIFYELVKTVRYDLVFVVDTIKNFSNKKRKYRNTPNYDASMKTKNAIQEVYQKYGHEIVPVEEGSVEDRLEFIEEEVRERFL